MSIEQVRKVLDKWFVADSRLALGGRDRLAAEIDALYASERGGDDVKEDLKNAIADWRGGSSYPCDLAAAILRAIDARVGAKGESGIDSPNVMHRAYAVAVEDVLEEITGAGAATPQRAVAAIRALAEAKASAEMDAKRAADNLLAVQGLLHQAITASAQVAP